MMFSPQILFSIIVSAVFATEENFNSANSILRENKRLTDQTVKTVVSPSLLSCSQACLRRSWCTSTNFNSLKKRNEGNCELNKHKFSPIDDTKLTDEPGTTFTMLLKGCLMSGCLNGGSCSFDEEKDSFACYERVYRNCAELYEAGFRTSGVYTIDPDNAGAFDVYCDQKTAGGGWTVFQKRLDGSVDFYRGWDDYKRGFGNLNGEFWLGLEKIHRLTKEQRRLRVDLEDFENQTAYAEYDSFGVGDEQSKYKLGRLGQYAGTAGDSLTRHHNMSFSTKDQDNDQYPSGSCAILYEGAWWYNDCHHSNLNGRYLNGSHSSFANGVNWYYWKGHHYSAKRAEMKIKPVEA